MIVYNVTVKIDPGIHEDWLEWMRQTHIPEVLATGMFRDHRICRLLEQDESDGFTYVIQYRTDSIEKLMAYQRDHAPALQAAHTERYRERFVAFRTVMEEI